MSLRATLHSQTVATHLKNGIYPASARVLTRSVRNIFQPTMLG